MVSKEGIVLGLLPYFLCCMLQDIDTHVMLCHFLGKGQVYIFLYYVFQNTETQY